ncbi:hypothetical protein jhhlp_003052 [Lomentospora prolificans]|uniref:Major facilitator superfamily (MFS) profile domain-containing protein n=1 Tax=Lomentospora prolificans TaxID=41688 RepID=A0A2N3NFR8_9PEZI|nr:hypothetical protein jhhlp_003052 [Lomentospora prolificans]
MTTADPQSTFVDEKLPGKAHSQSSTKEAIIKDIPLSELSQAPDGGLEAWLVATGGAFIFFCGLGFANSFGVFQEYYMTNQLAGESADRIAWIGSLGVFLQFFAGTVAGPLFDKYGAWIIRPGAVIFIFAVMITSICKQYWHFMLVQGVILGTGMGLMVFPAMTAVSQFFDKKRAAALGLAVSGSSIGGIVMPIALSKMLRSSLGFGWSVRILGFIMLPFLIVAIFTVKARLPPSTSPFFLASAWKDRTYVLLVFAVFFVFIGMFTPLFYLPSYAVSRGMDANLASYMLAILNGASTFGRILPGVLADKFGRINILAAAGLANGIVIFCFNEVTTTAEIVVYAVFFGFTSGMIISGGSAAVTICPKDPREMGTWLGMALAVASIAGLIGPPINGALVDKYHGFFEVAIFSGTMCVFGGFLALAAKKATGKGMLALV